MTRRRIALFSHDTQGLGHIRRNIEIAAVIVEAHPATDVLLIGATPAATGLPLPANTELLVLPAVAKDGDGAYAPAGLGLPLADLLDLRGRLVATAVRAFAPDLLIVDKLARGLDGELDEALRVTHQIRGHRGRAIRVVLGLRDVLDAPEAARRDWRVTGANRAVRAHYDALWVYGDPAVGDLVGDLELPADLADRVVHTGFLGHGRGRHVPQPSTTVTPPGEPYVLCLVGGGQDGYALARSFVDSARPAGHQSVVVAGPHMAGVEHRLLQAAAHRRGVRLHAFTDRTLELVESASAVVTMGGYNSVCEVLATGAPALVVPRVTPRLEQAVRAERLARHTHLDRMHPRDANPARLAGWLHDAVRRPRAAHEIDLDGLRRIPRLVEALLSSEEAAEARDVSA